MGIRFGYKLQSPFCTLRTCRHEHSDMAACQAPLWQGEDPRFDGSVPLHDHLGMCPSGIIGLFGLDPVSAATVGGYIRATWQNVIEIEKLEEHPNDVQRRIEDRFKISNAPGAGLRQFHTLLQYSPPLRFVFDVTTAKSFDDQKRICDAIVSCFSMPSEKKRVTEARSHAVFVLLTHRFWLNDSTELSDPARRIVPFLPTARVWFRSDRSLPDLPGPEGDRYSAESRDEEIPADEREKEKQPVQDQPCSIATLKPVLRERVYRRLRERTAQGEREIAFIVGGPGAGKSHLVQRLGDGVRDGARPVSVCTAGFNRNKGAQNPSRLLAYLCRLILSRLGWSGELPSSDAELDRWADFLPRLLHSISYYLCHPEAFGESSNPNPSRFSDIVLAIDGLDEASDTRPEDRDQLRKLLTSFPNPLPEHVHLLITSRPDLLDSLNLRIKPILSLDHAEWTTNNLRQFVEENVQTHAIDLALQHRILRVGGENFLATALVLAFLMESRRTKGDAAMRLDLDDLEHRAEACAESVFGPIYDKFWERFHDRGLQDRALITIATAFVAVPSPVPYRLLAHVAEKLNIDIAFDLPKALEELRRDSLIQRDATHNAYQVYHDSFRAYLVAKLATCDGYDDRLRTVRSHMAGWCLAWSDSNRNANERAFALKFAPSLLLETGKWPELYALLVGPPNGKSFEYLEARMKLDHGPHEMIRDFAKVQQAAKGGCSLSENDWQLLRTFIDCFIHTSHQFTEFPECCFQQMYMTLHDTREAASQSLSSWIETVREYWNNGGRPWLRLITEGHTSEAHLVFTRHTGRVTSLAVSPNGRWIVSGDMDHTIRVWDSSTAKEMKTIRLDRGIVCALAVSPNGKWVISAGSDHICRLWDATTYAEVLTFERHQDAVNCIAISPDNRWVVTGGGSLVPKDTSCRVWELKTGSERYCLQGHMEGVASVCISADGRRIASGSYDGVCRIWDAERGCALLEFRGHQHPITSLAFFSDNSRILSVSSDRQGVIWDARTGKEIALIFKRENMRTERAVLSPDERQVAILGRMLYVLDSNTGEVLNAFPVRSACRLEFSPDNKWIVSSGTDCRIWLLHANVSIPTAAMPAATHDAFGISGNRQFLITGDSEGTCHTWSSASGEKLGAFPVHRQRVTSLAFFPDGQWVASTDACTICIFEFQTGKIRSKIEWPPEERSTIIQISVSTDGRWMICRRFNGEFEVRRADTGEAVGSFSGMKWRTTCADMSSCRPIIALAMMFHSTIRIWDIIAGKLMHSLRMPRVSTVVKISPNGKYVAAIGHQGLLRLWDIHAGRKLKDLSIFERHKIIDALAFSHDSRWLASSCRDGCLCYNCETGEEIRFNDHPASHVVFSPDAGRLACVNTRGQYIIWNMMNRNREAVLNMDGAGHIHWTNIDGRLVVPADHGIAIFQLRSRR